MSIIDSLKQRKITNHVQRALWKDPFDTEALLQLALTLKEPDLDQKRKILHRILYLEPKHQTARQMLLAMDRAEIGGDPSRIDLAVILTDKSSAHHLESPLTLRYSIVHQILVYLFVVCAALGGLYFTHQAVILAAGMAFLIVPLWVISIVVEITDRGLHISRLFGLLRSEILWREIREVKPTGNGRGIQLFLRKGKTVVISAQINGYPFVLDILQQMRPDLFPATEVAWTEDMHQHAPTASVSAPR